MTKKQNLNISKGAKASIALFFASAVSSGISYFVTPIYTRVLPSDVFGQTSVFLTWVNVLSIIATFSLSNGVFNNGMSDWPDKRDEYSYSLLVLSNIISIISIILIWLCSRVYDFLRIDSKYIILMGALFITQPAYNFWTVRQRYEYKYRYVVIWSITCAVISPLCALLCIKYFSSSDVLTARIFGGEIPLVIIYFLFAIYLGKKAHFKVKTSFWKGALQFNLPLIPHYLSMYMLSSSDKIMISQIVSNKATAYYSVAYSVSAIAIVVWSAINSSLIPYTYEKCKEKKHEDVKKVAKPIILFFSLVCTSVILLAPEIVRFMGTDEYLEAVFVIPPIVGGVFFQVLYFLFANVIFFYKKPRYVMYASVTSCLFNVLLNYIFIKIFGYLAAGYTTLICYCLQAIFDYLALRKVTQKNVYDYKNIMVIASIVITISLFSNLLYGLHAVRYILFGTIMLLIIYKRKELLRQFRLLKN